MKKLKLSVAVMVATVVLSGCGTTGSSLLSGVGTSSTSTDATTAATSTAKSTTGSTGSSLLQNLLGTVLGSSTTISKSDILGTWKYKGADCVFETENLLLKAGGEVAASKIESKLNENLTKVGIAASTCSFTFNSDNTYTAVVAGRTISGDYTLDAANKKITMTYLAGLGTMTPHIVKSNSKLSLLYDADKLITMLNTMAAVSGNSSLKTLSTLASSYDGMMVGMELQK